MDLHPPVWALSVLAPAVLMLLAAGLPGSSDAAVGRAWRGFHVLSVLALVATVLTLVGHGLDQVEGGALAPWLSPQLLGAWMAVLVQFLGTVIASFSARYLEGEVGQRRYLQSLAGVLASVHVLLLAGHWVVLIAAWAVVGVCLQQLLCFYTERPFARLAAFKKRMADRAADVLLVVAATLTWSEVGSGAFSDLWTHLAQHGASAPLQGAALCVALAVVLRTALLPVHGWLIQVMEAPTPVSALLHAGVVNLGGFVLILFAPLLEQAAAAQGVLVVLGLATAVLASMVMLTRISIKVRLAWSTVAQMGFMVVECGLGLYTLAALHLMGHSLYKAHAFLASSSAVQRTRFQALQGLSAPAGWSLMLAPVWSVVVVWAVQAALGSPWPWWWSLVLALAWAPMLWVAQPKVGDRVNLPRMVVLQLAMGLVMVSGLAALAALLHALPLGTADRPNELAGVLTLVAMAALHVWLVAVQRQPRALMAWRRWSYAGLYLDEFYTRLALRLWPTGWMTGAPSSSAYQASPDAHATQSN